MLLTGLVSMAFMAFFGDRFIMEQIILSISVFTALVLVLVLILNFAESQLLPQGIKR